MTSDAIRIVMIDDDADFLEACAVILQAEGYHVECTTDPAVFKSYFDTLPKPRVAILDVEMPEITGFELAEHIRTQQASENIAVIILSAHREAGDQLRGFFNGANEYLFKPVGKHQLVEMVRKVIDNG
ncbi:MAG: PleD family two-component system response regulator [Planctomycetota bacterium]